MTSFSPMSLARGLLRGRLNDRHFPHDPQATDIFLVEFPKSGVTWLSCLVANSALIESGRVERATYASVNLHVPDIHQTRNIGELCYSIPHARFIKSHAFKHKRYVYVIYLVRDPKSVMLSYYRFRKYHDPEFALDYADFLADSGLGLPAWKKHVLGWVSEDGRGTRMHLVRYEDLLVDPLGCLSELNTNFGFGWSVDAMTEAVKLSSIGKMQEQERLFAKNAPFHKFNFVAGGLNDSDMTKLNDHIDELCQEERRLLGYLSESSP
jgi:hypothetical protein